MSIENVSLKFEPESRTAQRLIKNYKEINMNLFNE